jgi:hypothetical protein
MFDIISVFIFAQFSAGTSTMSALLVVTAPTATFGVIVATLIIFGVAIYFYLSIQILLP